jgi:flagellar biosynthesis protein FliR
MTTIVLALRGAAAIGVLTTLVGGIPRIVQVGLAIALGLWAAWVADAAVPPGEALALVALREVAIGATLGVVAAIPLVAAATAGRLVDLASGARTAGPYRALFGILAAAVFVGIDGHVSVARAIAESYRTEPALASVQPTVMAALGGLIASAVRLAVPWLVTAVVVEIAAGVGLRVAGRSAAHASGAAAVATPAALVMITATLVGTLAVALAALVRSLQIG